MSGDKKKEDLSGASDALRDHSASQRERHNAAQDLANRRWELHYKREAEKNRSSNTRKGGR
jgi:hypothetical protein